MSHQDERWHTVADGSALDDPGSLAFTLWLGGTPLLGFVVRKDGALFAYENFCPHAGRQLNWGPDRFLTSDRSQIMCAAHGALFEITSGRCTAGPCVGERLRPIPVREVGRDVQVRHALKTWDASRPDPGN